jgi:hypothetical protein
MRARLQFRNIARCFLVMSDLISFDPVAGVRPEALENSRSREFKKNK